ncbi:unnamed protein product [Cercopithifilaria johnstoni]|uniref:Uncharacterized protein n=1 Tax=Cercopithifilaria johnstoni TaxID=2874296 RepID=A0A8J2Q666_9BILA|nr:unnamed protein product [Cercopithifilaria johnstoni]
MGTINHPLVLTSFVFFEICPNIIRLEKLIGWLEDVKKIRSLTWKLVSKSFQVSFGLGVYVGIYLDQNRQIQLLSSPKELFNRFLDEADHFLTGVRGESTSERDQVRKMEDDFFKDVEDWFKPKKRFP